MSDINVVPFNSELSSANWKYRIKSDITGFIKTCKIPVRFKLFYEKYLKDNELFQHHFKYFNIDEDNTKSTLLNIITFYIYNISSSYDIKYFMMIFTCYEFTQEYFYTSGTITINNDKIEYSISKD